MSRRAVTPPPEVAAPAAEPEAMPRRLEAILRALPPSEFDSLVARLGVRIDPAKRLDAQAQVARAVVGLPEIRDPSRLPPASRELLYRIAEAGGELCVRAVPAGLEALLGRGIVYAQRTDAGIVLVLPIALLVQLKTWEGEDPRSVRALLSRAPFETLSSIAAHYLGRPAAPPISLALELAWERIADKAALAAEIDRLAPLERKLLESIDNVGGEVDTEELLDLEREPLRLRGATGVSASRRGGGFSLERRALLVPLHPNRHIVPSEVSRVAFADDRREQEARRASIRSLVRDEDHVPRRARFVHDPAPTALALAIAVRDGQSAEVRGGVGTPRSLVFKLAARFGRETDATGLIAGVSRAIGLWESSALLSATPPGSLEVGELGYALFSAWRRGGAWDEARLEPEVMRVAEGSRDASPIAPVREMVLGALQELGEGRWVPWSALAEYVTNDPRARGASRLLRRWAERANVPACDALEVAKRIALESLPALGVVDLGEDEPEAGQTGPAMSLRLTPRGKAFLFGKASHTGASREPSQFVDGSTLRIGPATTVASVLSIAPFVEIARASDALELAVTAGSLHRVLALGAQADVLRARLEAVAELSESVARTLTEASAVIGRAAYVAASAFLWVEDVEVRELLRTRKATADLFVDPSPQGGLLVVADVDVDRLVRRCRAVGIEVDSDAGVLRAREGGESSQAETPRPGGVTPRRTSSSAKFKATTQRSR